MFGLGKRGEFYGDYAVEKYSGKGNKPRYYILMGTGRGHKSLANERSDKRGGGSNRSPRTRSTGGFVEIDPGMILPMLHSWFGKMDRKIGMEEGKSFKN